MNAYVPTPTQAAPGPPALSYTPPDLREAPTTIGLLHRAAEALDQHPLRQGNRIRLPSHGHLLITGDLHDNRLNFHRIVKLADLDAGDDRHLILHEVIHGKDRINNADLSVRMLANCADLVLKYPGRVHILQSNHELAQYRGEGITKDGQSVCDAFDDGLEFLYHEHADEVRDAAHEYIRALPLAVHCDNGLMVSHSLPAPRRIEEFDKSILDRVSTDEDILPRHSAYDMVWGRHQNKKITDELAEAWGVKAFVVGHQPAEMGYELVADNTLILASDHEHGVALPVDLAQTYDRDDLLDHLRPLNSVPV